MLRMRFATWVSWLNPRPPLYRNTSLQRSENLDQSMRVSARQRRIKMISPAPRAPAPMTSSINKLHSATNIAL